MILNFLRKPLTVVDFLVLLLLSPVIISIVIFIAIILEPSDIPSIKDQPYECGRFGNQQMKIDRNYLFFARVEYQDVNYWGKNVREQHNIKGCDDQIQNASFDVKWPEMEPSDGFQLDSKNVNNITVALNQRTIWLEEQENKGFFDSIASLKLYLRDIATHEEMSAKEINEKKVFNLNLGLYQIDVRGIGRVSQRVFWQEIEGKGVGVIINCHYFQSENTSCELSYHVPNYGFNTSYITIYFHAELLPHWQEIQQDSFKMIDSFRVRV
ncbi:hypothetical protein [Acinetobacter sp. MF4640]|uniref:hypothetical protein n=1 Tax=Acinetobacter sp. MF4640 TaxID=1960826 RepID=UPI000994B335|nr:hypothetical protein [Acinetobacter sp. MF4640]OOW16006.1 hypothetical protein MF4640_02520 [Acinetobacter sp. MF4640]